ncbi:hypothetical protein B9Z65_6534 [Elsinoe australis]|uniref:Transport protein USO1 n=1 Tax=Elsinoe australis TaxID=40998 RepID=A0A2P8A8W9_9PEZI|nr:hypothetical protein B9Z65_6534 [Elsinoe australis]
MPSVDRDVSSDRELRHRPSFSESASGRLSVPMWDSADPDRCPPPLPIPPGSPSLQTKANASAGIQAAANKLHERARESLGASYLAHVSPNGSPEKSLVKGAAHRRMQSAHVGGGKDLKSYLDGMRSGSPERTPGAAADYYSSSNSRPDTPTRVPPKPIIGENTPPSATMRALQSFVVKDDLALPDITNGRTAKSGDPEVSAQLLKLTTIATNLQTEMSALSRRSKDNAVDLLSLKEAANKRDEDIRKNLKDLMSSPSLLGPASPSLGRGGHFGLGLLDSKAYGSPPSLPRAASHNSLFDTGSPSPYSVEGAASVAMLEKIIREMVTKEGQERLLSTLSELTEKSSKMSTEAVTRVNDLAEFIKDKNKNPALHGNTGALVRSGSPGGEIPADLKTLLGKIKDSVTSNGGMTAEIKALIRELRGEILGMGRELGRKLDQVESAGQGTSRSPEEEQASRMEMQRVVNQSVKDLRDHMENLIQESARQSSALVQARGDSSSEDMYAVVKHALAEHGAALVQSQNQDFDKEEILSAVRTACENFKPEIELQQYGLERDEILEVLKEGLAEHRSGEEVAQASQVNKQEVYDAMQEALQSVQLPSPILDTHAIKADMLASIRECLEEFKSTNPGLGANPLDDGATRELINDAIRSGLEEHSDKTQRVMEISRDDLFDAVKAGLDGSSIPFGGFGEQVLQQLHELVDGMKVEFKQYSAANGRDTEQVLDAVKDGLEVLRGQIETYVDRAQDVTGKDEIIDIVRSGLDSLRQDVQGFVAEGPASGKQELLEYIKSEFEHLHATIGGEPLGTREPGFFDGDKSDILAAIENVRSEVGARGMGSEIDGESLESVKEEIAHLRDTLAPLLIKVGAAADKEEMLATIKEAMAELPSQPGAGINTDVLEAIRGEFENLQSTVTRTGSNRADMEEMLDTIRLGLDDLRSHVDKKTENPEKHILNGEILDALNEGLDNLRSDVNKTLEKPVDMTVTYEILDTLKEGLAGLRADMDKLSAGRGASPDGAIVLADSGELTRDGPVDGATPAVDSLKKDDLEKMEVLLAQLQIKVEAMDKNIQDIPAQTTRDEPAPEGISKEHLTGLEDMLKEVQSAVADLAAKEKVEVENAVTKADTDAIETLLRNTKSQIEELQIPGVENLASREQTDAVEAVARVAKDAIYALATKVDESLATKEDVAVVEVLATDVKTALEELKEKTQGLSEEEEAKRLTKPDLDVLGVICTEIKDKVSEMVLPDVESLPEKADIEQLQGLINDLRDGHEKFREQYDKDIGVTAQAFDDRRKDTEEIVGSVSAIKSLLEEFKQEALDRDEAGTGTLDELKDSLTAITEKVETNPTISEDVKALAETVKTEFEKATASLDAIKTDHGEQLTAHLEKGTEHKDAIITDLSTKIDGRIDELVAKYTEAQTAVEEKAAAQEEALKSTKDLAGELKLSIDTLGTALTASSATFNESTEKLSQESSTVFNRVDDVFNKLDETQAGLKGEHAATRDEVAKTAEGIAGVKDELLEHNPKVLVSLAELHALVSAHFEHAKTQGEEHAEALKGLGEGHKVHVEEIKTAFGEASAGLRALPEAEEGEKEVKVQVDEVALHEKLDQLLGRPAEVATDAAVHEKLDKLVESVPGNNAELLEKIHEFVAQSREEGEEKSVQLEKLDAIHAQMMATAAEVTAFVAGQTQRISDASETREREAEELGKLIERHETRKEHLEADIEVLNSDREELREEVARFREEKDALAREKSRLAADVHALHAALAIRKEELAAMESRADKLERRVLEGLMDQSRAALLKSSVAAASAKSKTPKQSPRKKPMRDLRVVSGQSEASTVTAPSLAPSLASSISQAAHAVVRQKPSRPSMARNSGVAMPAERRIMSLSQISHNAGGGSARQSLVGPPVISAPQGRLESLKRSQSVRTSGLDVPRKSSWSAGGAGINKRGFTPLGLSVIGDEEADKENEAENFSEMDTESRRTSVSRDQSYASETGSVVTGDDDRSRYSESFVEFSDAGSRRTSGQTVTEGELSRVQTAEGERRSMDSAMASMVAQQVRDRLADGELDDDARTETDLGVVSAVGTVDDDGDAEAAIVLASPMEEKAEEKQLVVQTPGVTSMDWASKDGKDEHDHRHDFATPADSGLGSDLPTAALGRDEFGGYFPLAGPESVIAE